MVFTQHNYQTLNRAMEIPDYKRQNMTAEDVMIPLIDLIVMRDDAKANEALLQMTRGVGVGLGGTEEQQSRKKQIGKKYWDVNWISKQNRYNEY
jgi:hypothetical protein